MFRTAHRPYLLLAFLLLAAVARGQFDTCITFAEMPLYQFPGGWMSAHGPNYTSTNPQDARVVSLSHDSPNALLFTLNTDCYISMPYMSPDFSQGAYMQYWALQGQNLEVGTMTNPNDYTTFHSLTYISSGVSGFWYRYVVDLSAAPQGDHYIAFHKMSGSSSATIDDIRVMTNGCMMWNFHTANYELENMEGEFVAIYRGCDTDIPPVQFTWNAVGSPAVQVSISASGSMLHDSIYYGVDTISVQFVENVAYTVSVWADCGPNGGCTTSTDIETYTITLIQPECDSSSCVDTRKLFSTKVTPFYGDFDNPYQNVGIVSGNDITARHLVCTDTTATDPVVGSQLRMVAPGDDHSVRLGNRMAGRKAEAMLYNIHVDTTDFDMLILKYAAVMQDPNHTLANQPRFRIEMLDADGNLIEPASCNSYDFVANSSLGWNVQSYNGQLLLWKDWTIVGIDLSAYHGQNVQLRLTTYDCDEGGHFGYAYYNLHCAKKTIAYSTCSEGDINHVEAPDGFNYSWRRDDSYAVISTSRSADLPADGHTYYCDLSFIGDPTCVVTLSVVSLLVLPEADFDYTVGRNNCRFRVDFSDRSHLVVDTATACDSVFWNFGPLGTSTLRNPVVFFPDSGTYTVSLVAALSGGDCRDTITRQLRLEYPFDTVDTSFCANHTLSFMDTLFATAGSYVLPINCDSLRLLNLAVRDTALIDTVAVVCDHLDYRGSTFLADTVACFVYTNAAGCDSSYRLHLTVNPAFDVSDTVVVCPGRPFLYRGVDYGGPTAFDTIIATVHGCDSLVHVALFQRDTVSDIMASYSFDGIHWADTLPLKGCAPATLYLRDTTPGIVSHLWTLAADTVVSGEGTLQYPFDDSCYDATATLMLVDINGCSDTLVWPVYVFQSPRAEFSWLPFRPADICPEAEFSNYSQPADCQWQWTFVTADGTTDTHDEYSPVYHWQGDMPRGDFDVTLAASRTQAFMPSDTLTITHTCVDTVTHTVTIVTAWLEFPNLVSPNGDGVNDRWEVVNLVDLGLYPMNEVWIFNQWGVQVFHARDVHRHEDFWDPAATGSPDGTYFFRFLGKSACGGIVRRNGVIEVLR